MRSSLKAREMKAILEFELPDDQEAFAAATKASDLLFALNSISNELRSRAKYGHGDDAKYFQEFREWMHQEVPDSIWELLG